MKNLILLVILLVVAGSALTIYGTLSPGASLCRKLAEQPNARALARYNTLTNGRIRPKNPGGPSCARPEPADRQICHALEQQLLASTVRLEWQRWRVNDNSPGYTLLEVAKGYGTIKEGRYLVTHNHAGMPLTAAEDGIFVTLSIFTTGGDPILLYKRLNRITITEPSPETLLLDFGTYGGQGLFESNGLPSAKFRSWESAPLQPGLEVAQIGHDGSTVKVDWVTIDRVILQGDTPRVELANFVRPGASGGGVFWNGYHIANTWTQVTVCDSSSGAVVGQHSVAALNSP